MAVGAAVGAYFIILVLGNAINSRALLFGWCLGVAFGAGALYLLLLRFGPWLSSLGGSAGG
jgi:hypothetical protein